MKITFDEISYEFKTFFSENDGYELHLFRDDKLINITTLHCLPPPYMMFDMYVGILKKYVEFTSIKVNVKK
jgi:hypothetical protein